MAQDNKATSHERQTMIQGILGSLNAETVKNIKEGFKDSARITPEDRRQNLREVRQREGKAEAPRAHYTMSQQPLLDLLRQVKTVENNPIINRIPGIQEFTDDNLLVRGNFGLNIDGVTDFELDTNVPTEDVAKQAARYKEQLKAVPTSKKVGYAMGSLASDFVNDSARSVWWLINAPQAVQNLSSETITNTINPDFFGDETLEDLHKAVNDGDLRYRPQADANPDFSWEPGSKMADDDMRKDPSNYIPGSPGVNKSKGKGGRTVWSKRRFNPNVINVASMLPGALAINAGIGLTGRREGYAMSVPDEDDERQTSNAIAEVGSRYFLGREGRLLDAEDFLLERPDVSRGEYNAYKGYLRDRDIDLNPFGDGKINLGGIVKTNPDGIRGAEVSFLGKSLPVNDTLLPAVASLGGTALGAFVPRRLKMKSKAGAIASLFGGGMAGLAAGNAAGNSIEQERRRRNFEGNNPNVDFDIYKQNAAALLKNKMAISKANPNRAEEREKSKTGFSKRNQQAALQEYAQKQQAMVDQLLAGEQKDEAQDLVGKTNWALDKASAIDAEISRRREGIDAQPQALGMG